MVITGRTRNALALLGHVGSNPTVSAHKKAGNLRKQTIGFCILEKCDYWHLIFQKNVLRLPQDLHNRIIVLRIMWEGAVRAILDPSAVFSKYRGFPGQCSMRYMGQ